MSEEELKDIFGSMDMFDKDSSEYKRVQRLNGIATKTKKEEDDPLNIALSQAIHLNDELKERYIYIAGLYMSDMEHNLFRNQFDLNNEYTDVSIDEWNDFLSDRIVSVYINKHKRTLLKAAAKDNLADPTAKNKRDNLQLIKNIEAQEQSEQNKNICIIRLPDIYDE